jgi:hypothetical protein
MTNDQNAAPSTEHPPEKSATTRSRPGWLWPAVQFVAALVVAGAALVFLIWSPGHVPLPSAETSEDAQAVKLLGPHLLSIQAGTPLENKLAIAQVAREMTSAPLLKVTGSIVARLPLGNGQTEGRWDFNVPELATAYADWLKARADVPFNEKQLASIRQLTKAKVDAQSEVVARLEKLVRAGTDPEKDLVAAQADLLQTKIQGQKDEHEADTNLRTAVRTLATLERQLFQAGIDPLLLLKNTESKAIVVAEVPEAKVGLVRPGQACAAQFFAFPDVAFAGRVGSLAPTLSKERRTLRVFFEVSDPQGRLKPGMFAEIGLGTDPRETLMAPADGLLHVGRADYVLAAVAKAGQWRIAEVKTGELSGARVEVLDGLKAGDRVIGAGAILLKPYVVRDVQQGAARWEREVPAAAAGGTAP